MTFMLSQYKYMTFNKDMTIIIMSVNITHKITNTYDVRYIQSSIFHVLSLIPNDARVSSYTNMVTSCLGNTR